MNARAYRPAVIPGAASHQRCGGKGTHLVKIAQDFRRLDPLPSARASCAGLAGEDIYFSDGRQTS